jgi:hypothetical protein
VQFGKSFARAENRFVRAGSRSDGLEIMLYELEVVRTAWKSFCTGWKSFGRPGNRFVRAGNRSDGLEIMLYGLEIDLYEVPLVSPRH